MLRDALLAEAMRLGFTHAGVVPAAPARRLDAYLQWLEAGLHGEMGYMARPDRVARRRDPAQILPGVRSIVCVGLNYFTGRAPAEVALDPSRGRISNYAWRVDYHDVMTPRLEALANWLRAQTSHDVASRAYVDTGAILERDHAEQAGFGFTGKNTMLIDPRCGSWFFLGELLTTLDLRSGPEVKDESQTQVGCGTCRRCLGACPTDAFPQPYVLDARRCISYLTIELKGWIPRELRSPMGNWVYGCDVCQEVCPFNRFATVTAEQSFAPADPDDVAPPLLELLALDEEAFARRFADSPIKRIGRARLVRNAAVAAGNWGDASAMELLRALLEDPQPLVRGHAAWALHQLGGEAVREAMALALAREADEAVRRELVGD